MVTCIQYRSEHTFSYNINRAGLTGLAKQQGQPCEHEDPQCTQTGHGSTEDLHDGHVRRVDQQGVALLNVKKLEPVVKRHSNHELVHGGKVRIGSQPRGHNNIVTYGCALRREWRY